MMQKEKETKITKHDMNFYETFDLKTRYDPLLPRTISGYAATQRHAECCIVDSMKLGANSIKIEGVETRYIASEAPINPRYFWRLILQESVPVILALTNDEDLSKDITAGYRPRGPLDIHHYFKHADGTDLDPKEKTFFGDLSITLEEKTSNQTMTTRIFLVCYEDRTHRITHIHYTGWKDMQGTSIETVVNVLKEHQANTYFIHCYAGMGRTGTTIAGHAMHMLHSQKLPISIPDLKKVITQQITAVEAHPMIITALQKNALKSYQKELGQGEELTIATSTLSEPNVTHALPDHDHKKQQEGHNIGN